MRSIAALVFATAALSLSAQQTQPPSERPFSELQAEFEQAERDWSTAWAAARKDKDQAKLTELGKDKPRPRYVPPMLAGAKRHAGTPEAVPFLDWLAFHGDRDVVKGAFVELIERHLTAPETGRAASRIVQLLPEIGREQALAWLDKIIAGNPHPKGIAQALFTRAGLFTGTRGTGTPEQRAAALVDLRRAAELESDSSLGRLIREAIRGEEVFGIGRKAPDIEGKDLDGVAFKMSDYKGKVILLDFWGDW